VTGREPLEPATHPSQSGAEARERWVAGASLVVLAGASVLPPGTAVAVRLVPALVAVALVVIAWRRPSPAGGMAVLVATLLLFSGISPLLWQINMGVALGALALLARWRSEFGAPRLERGRLMVGGALLCALVTPVALVGWVALLRPDVSNVVAAIPDYPLGALLAGGVAFAIVNALLEEWIWRGVFQPRLAHLFSPPVAVVGQALSFGIAHAWGFPRGVVGVLLVGIWGTMLGILRHQTRGLLAVVLAHIVADATIAAIVLLWLR
jgi:membrane protease YdiL (CAAX protease family)